MHRENDTHPIRDDAGQPAGAEGVSGLLERARAQEPDALTELCAAYYPKILRFMRYRVGPNEADDLAGEVFVKVMRSIGSQTGSFEAWLYRLARNVIIDRVRYHQARPETELSDAMTETMANGKNGHAASTAHMDMENALAMMNEEHRELLTLKFVQGLTNEEIGEITGQKVSAIRAMQFRALKAMRAVLDRKGADR